MKMEKTITYVIAALVGTGIGLLCYNLYKKRSKILNNNQPLEPINPEIIERLTMKEIVAFFKVQNLNRGVDVPFMADASRQEFISMLDVVPPTICGTKTICLGVYNERTNNIKVLNWICSVSIDDQVKKLIENDTIVVLS